jgi:hypothetical protein
VHNAGNGFNKILQRLRAAISSIERTSHADIGIVMAAIQSTRS